MYLQLIIQSSLVIYKTPRSNEGTTHCSSTFIKVYWTVLRVALLCGSNSPEATRRHTLFFFFFIIRQGWLEGASCNIQALQTNHCPVPLPYY